MKLIKLAIISVVVLFAIITCLGLLLPSTVRVTRNINISAPQDTLFQYIGDINNWKFWLEGAADSTVQITSQNSSGKGAAAVIGGNNVTMTKASIHVIETIWQGERGSSQKGVFELLLDTTASTTNVNWYFEQKVSWYPWERLSTLANDKVLGPVMEHSLDKLKSVTEEDEH